MSQESKRFVDPLGDYMRAAQESSQQRLEAFPVVQEVYQGFYFVIEPHTKEGANCLNSSGGITGTQLTLGEAAGGLGLYAQNHGCIALLDRDISRELSELISKDWTVQVVLASTIFEFETKDFSANCACFCYAPELSEGHRQAMEAFIDNMVHRIGGGTKPRLSLTQDQFVKVLKSGGGWYLTKDEPWPKLPQGSIYFRRRKTVNDRLVGAALKGNKGCVVTSWIATVVIVAAIALAIWFFFFR